MFYIISRKKNAIYDILIINICDQALQREELKCGRRQIVSNEITKSMFRVYFTTLTTQNQNCGRGVEY